MTPSQRNTYFNEVGECARILNRPIEETRKRIHIWAFKEPRSAKDINHKADFDELKKVWASIKRGDDLDTQLALHDQPNKRIIHLIQYEYRATLAVLLPIKYRHVYLPLPSDPLHPDHSKCPNFHLADKYLTSVLENRFKKTDIKQLDTIKRVPNSQSAIRNPQSLSELEMFRDTIARCISQARQKSGLTVHDLNILVGLDCDCADCRDGIIPTQPSAIQSHQKELVA